MSFSGIFDIDQKICEYIHLDDIVNVLLIHVNIKKLIVNNLDCLNKESCHQFIIKLLEIDEINLAKEVMDFTKDSDIYRKIYVLLSKSIALTSKSAINFFSLLPNNYDQQKLVNVKMTADALLNILKPALDRRLYILVDHLIHRYRHDRIRILISCSFLTEIQQKELNKIYSEVWASRYNDKM